MIKINQQIKDGSFERIYLLYGQEDYLKRQYMKKLKTALINKEDNMNYRCFKGANINFSEVIDLSETMPFFTDRRLIVIEDSGVFKTPKEQLVNYIEHVPATTNFIFVENEVDKRSRMFKKVKEIGYACELERQTEDTLIKWVNGLVAAEHKTMAKETVKLFLLKAGFSMENISKELEKLLCYTLDKKNITNDDVEAICTAEITGKIFEMIDAMSTKNKKKLFSLYFDLISVKEPPMRIIYMLVRQFNLMLQVKELLQRGYGQEIIKDKTKLHSFIVSKMISQLKGFSMEDIKISLNELLEIEEMIKTGRLIDKVGVELFLAKIIE